MYIRRPILASLVGMLAVEAVWAESGSAPQIAPGELVLEVTAPRLSRDLYDTPAAVSVVDTRSALKGQQRVQLDEALQGVPGLYFQNRYNYAQNLRISTRGFGARAPFGVRGLQLRVDGIPYTLPDGQSQVDAIDLDSTAEVQVIRGPAAVQYGNGAGGVIDVTTLSGGETRPLHQLSVDGGGDGFRKLSARTGAAFDGGDAHLSVSRLAYDGYRAQSEVDKRLLSAKVNWHWGDDRAVTVVGSWLDLPTAQDPGGLTAAQVAADRRQATAPAIALNAGQQVEQQTLGVIYRDESAVDGYWQATVFASRRDFFQQLPFPGNSQISFDRWFYGVGVERVQAHSLGRLPLRSVVGVEWREQVDDRQRFSVSPQGAVTGQTADEEQNASSVGVFAQSDARLTDALTLSLGARYDRLRLAIDDRLGANSGRRVFDEFSGVAGLSYRWAGPHQLYGNLASAYESPTFTEFANPAGTGFNPDLEPQTSLAKEVGMRGWLGALSYDLAVFSIRVRDEIVPYEEDGRTFYENAGETDRDGVELGLAWYPTPAWRLSSALTVARYHFRQFAPQGGEDVSGNQLPGLPRQQWVSQLRWQGTGGHYATLDGRYSSGFYAENSNETWVDSVWLLDTRVGTERWLGRQQWALYGGIRNLTDTRYMANVRINANSDRPLANRGYFEPAPGRTAYVGLQVGF